MGTSRKRGSASSDLNVRVGQRIRELRQGRNWSQQQLAEEADLSVDAVGKVERGVYSPSLETLAKIAEGLGVTVVQLVGDQDSRASRSKTSVRKQVQQLVAGADDDQLQIVMPTLRALLRALVDHRDE